MAIFNIPFGDTIMTKLYKTRISSMLAIGLLAAILAQQTSTAETVNSPGSVLHGRTTEVADDILNALGIGFRQYNQVPNLAQLRSITSLIVSHAALTSLRADDFDGLTNLQTLHLNNNLLTTLPLGIFDRLTNLQSLSLSNNLLTTLPLGIFDKLTSL